MTVLNRPKHKQFIYAQCLRCWTTFVGFCDDWPNNACPKRLLSL